MNFANKTSAIPFLTIITQMKYEFIFTISATENIFYINTREKINILTNVPRNPYKRKGILTP